jgi:glyoxylase-like metal-dependent hydrolase (beta-lactamase superfamily II)
MHIHHLNCGSMCPHGRRLMQGEGGWLEPAQVVCHVWLIEGADGLTLVDTGLGTTQVEGMVHGHLKALMRPTLSRAETALAQVQALGFKANEVRRIVLTHLDFDHAGALADFPDAEVHVHAPELDAASKPRSFMEKQRYEARLWAHGPRWVRHASDGERWNGFEAVRALGGDGAADEILLVPLVGHTRGHTGVAVRDGDGWRLHCGDAYFFHTEVGPSPHCPTGLNVFQSLLAVDNDARKANQARLAALNAAGGVTLNSAHCPHELARDAAPIR